jgi:hypothetical protein
MVENGGHRAAEAGGFAPEHGFMRNMAEPPRAPRFSHGHSGFGDPAGRPIPTPDQRASPDAPHRAEERGRDLTSRGSLDLFERAVREIADALRRPCAHDDRRKRP